MHPLLAPHLHPKCAEIIEALKRCHEEVRRALRRPSSPPALSALLSLSPALLRCGGDARALTLRSRLFLIVPFALLSVCLSLCLSSCLSGCLSPLSLLALSRFLLSPYPPFV